MSIITTSRIAIAAALLTTAALNAQAQTDLLLHSFEGTDEGYVTGGTFGADSVTPDNSGIFATDGTYSLKIEGHTDSYSQPAKVDLDAATLDAFSTISFDYHLPGFNGYAVLGSRIAAETWGGNYSETVLADTGTISWDYKVDAGAGYTAGAAWSTFILDGFNEAGSGSTMSPVYIDNVRLRGGTPPDPFSFSWEEGSLEGWTQAPTYSGLSPIASVDVAGGAPPGAITDGNSALRVKVDDWDQWTIQVESLGGSQENTDALRAMKANDTVEFDLFVESGEILPGSFTQVALVLNQAGGFAIDYHTLSAADAGVSYPVSWNYAADPLYDPETPWLQIKFVTNSGEGGNAISEFYVDNMRFTTADVLISGDYDNSGAVRQGDLDLVLLNWGADASVTGVPAGWVNMQPTGQIGQAALDGVLLNWGNAALAAATAVPEPSSAILLLVGSVLTRTRRRS